MIACHELRIGNYVLAGKELQKVSMISQEQLLFVAIAGEKLEPGLVQSLHSVSPVVLSDDILSRCGFVYHAYFRFWQLIEGVAPDRSEMNIDRDYNILDFMRKPIVKNVASLHQLQNIHFMLKGRELNFRAGD